MNRLYLRQAFLILAGVAAWPGLSAASTAWAASGGYPSDPAGNSYWNWIVDKNSYLQAGEGDRFLVGHNFLNHSLQNGLWDTDAATLILNGSKQQLALAGADYGASYQGYDDNFAWDELKVSSGVELKIKDGNTLAGAALYVGSIELGGGIEQLMSIYSDYNIYYDPLFAGNEWLNSGTYDFNGAGKLTPVGAVPVPDAVWLFGSGLVALIGIRRRVNS